MDLYRQINTTFWEETADEDFSPDEQHIYLYFLTCNASNQCGILRVSQKRIGQHTNIPKDRVDKALEGLQKRKKVLVNAEENEIMILNRHRFISGSPSIAKRVEKELASVKTPAFIETFIALRENGEVAIPDHTPKRKRSEPKEDGIPYATIIETFNRLTGKDLSPRTALYRQKIKARWNDGMREEDFESATRNCIANWKDREDMLQYIRIETIFSDKMDGYRNSRTLKTEKAKSIKPCPLCGYQNPSGSAGVCLQCTLDIKYFDDPEKVASFKEGLMSIPGMMERLGLKE